MEFFGMPIPEELRQQLMQQKERNEMEADAFRHDAQRLFDELDKDSLLTLRQIFSAFAGSEDGRLAAYYEGITVAAIKFRFNVCPSCGTDHTEEALKEMSEQQPKEKSKPPADPRQVPGQLQIPETDSVMKLGTTEPLTERERELMVEYNLDDLRDEDSRQLLGFICKGCEIRYPSIEDRMLKAPDECHGCIHKTKWGG